MAAVLTFMEPAGDEHGGLEGRWRQSVLMMMMYDGENDGDDDGGRRVTVSVVFMDLRKRVSWQASLRAAPAGTAMICRFSPKE
eukprot:1340202-Rhodomonas_salina.1